MCSLPLQVYLPLLGTDKQHLETPSAEELQRKFHRDTLHQTEERRDCLLSRFAHPPSKMVFQSQLIFMPASRKRLSQLAKSQQAYQHSKAAKDRPLPYLLSLPKSRATSSLPGLRARERRSSRFFSTWKASRLLILTALGTSAKVAYCRLALKVGGRPGLSTPLAPSLPVESLCMKVGPLLESRELREKL